QKRLDPTDFYLLRRKIRMLHFGPRHKGLLPKRVRPSEEIRLSICLPCKLRSPISGSRKAQSRKVEIRPLKEIPVRSLIALLKSFCRNRLIVNLRNHRVDRLVFLQDRSYYSLFGLPSIVFQRTRKVVSRRKCHESEDIPLLKEVIEHRPAFQL